MGDKFQAAEGPITGSNYLKIKDKKEVKRGREIYMKRKGEMFAGFDMQGE